MASRNEQAFLQQFIGKLIGECGNARVLDTALPSGVTAQLRTDGRHDYVILLNFSESGQTLVLDGGAYMDLLSGRAAERDLHLPPLGIKVLKRSSRQPTRQQVVILAIGRNIHVPFFQSPPGIIGNPG